MPDLTVAIPTYNGARHLAEALRGILAQQGAAFDLLVCDDRSDDDTLAIVREVAGDRARIEVNPRRLGLAGNWNRCVEQGGTQWVHVFHQDDVMRPGHLAAHVQAIRSWHDVSVGLVVGAAEPIDEAGRPLTGEDIEPGTIEPGNDLERRGMTSFYPPGSFLASLAVRNPLRCSAVTLNKPAHAATGGFDASYHYVVDWDFWIRVARGWGVVWCSGPASVAFRWHAASETQRFKAGTLDLEEQVRLLARLYREDGGRLPDLRTMRHEAHRRLARAYLNRAYEAAHASDRRLSLRCLRRALDLSPGIIRTIVRDPRLVARLALGRQGLPGI
jgi:GT2 family glycosyltransferase